MFQLLLYQMAAQLSLARLPSAAESAHIGIPMSKPANWFMIAKVGMVRGTSQILNTFQSKVGSGFKPRPPKGEVMADRDTLSGEIQVIHEKYDRAWKMKPGKKK